MKRAGTADQDDLPDGMNLPEEIAIRETRFAALAEAKRKIEARAQERFAHEQAEYEAKVAERARKAKATGKKPEGRPPQPPDPGPQEKEQVNFTDEESRIMPAASGGFEQAYNAQAAVDMETQLIVAQHVTQHPNDKQEVVPVLDAVAAVPETLGPVTHLVADTGYHSEANAEACEAHGIEPLMASGRRSHHPPVGERFAEPLPPPEDALPASDTGREGGVREAQDHRGAGVRHRQTRARVPAVSPPGHRGGHRGMDAGEPGVEPQAAAHPEAGPNGRKGRLCMRARGAQPRVSLAGDRKCALPSSLRSLHPVFHPIFPARTPHSGPAG